MDLLTIELASNASGELFPDNTLSSFTNFSPEQVNLEGNGRLQFQKYPTLLCTKYKGGEVQIL